MQTLDFSILKPRVDVRKTQSAPCSSTVLYVHLMPPRLMPFVLILLLFLARRVLTPTHLIGVRLVFLN